MTIDDNDPDYVALRLQYIEKAHVPVAEDSHVHIQALIEAYLCRAASLFIASRLVRYSDEALSEATTAALEGLEMWLIDITDQN